MALTCVHLFRGKTDESYDFRRVTSLIYELTEKDFKIKEALNDTESVENQFNEDPFIGEYLGIVGAELKELVEETAQVGTKLWFTDNDETKRLLTKLIATGQATMCYNLYKYLYGIINSQNKGYEKLDHKTRKELSDLLASVKNDWLKIKKNPFYMITYDQD